MIPERPRHTSFHQVRAIETIDDDGSRAACQACVMGYRGKGGYWSRRLSEQRGSGAAPFPRLLTELSEDRPPLRPRDVGV